jgi:site-specific recombinase XerC
MRRFMVHLVTEVEFEDGDEASDKTVQNYQKQLSETVRCPSSDDLRHIAGLQKGGSGPSVIEIMRHAVDAASDGLRLSGA